MARKRRTAKQRAATRKLVAMNRRRRNPGPRRVAKKTRQGTRPTMRTAMTNPKRRRHSVRRRRNPNGGRLTMRNVMNRNLIPAFQGASGGLLLDIAWGYIPPIGGIDLKTGQLRHVFKGLGAIGMGMVAQQFMRPATATQLTTGALTTVLHTAMRETVAQFMPNIPLGTYMEGMGYYNAGQIASPQYGNNNMGEYENNNMSQVPYGSPMTPMGEYMGPDDMGAYESGIEGDLMGAYE